MNRHPLVTCCVLAGVCLALSSGCAGSRQVRKAVAENEAPDVSPERHRRSEEVARDFDRRRDEAQLTAAESRLQQNDAIGCRDLLTDLLKRNPNHQRARLLLADSYASTGDAAQAVEELRKAVAAEPKNALAHHSLAEALDQLGKRTEAIEHYEQATQLDPTSQAYAASFKSAVDRETAPKPSTVTDMAASQTHTPPQTTNEAAPKISQPADGITQTQGTQASGVILASAQALDPPPAATAVTESGPSPLDAGGKPLDPHNRQDPLNQAVTALAQGDLEAAIEIADQALPGAPEQEPALYRVLGAAHYQRGEYQAAQSALAQALSLDKADALSYFLMGSTLSKLGEDEAAQRHYDAAASLDARFAR